MGLKTVAILFVLGATIVTGQFIPRLLRPTPYDMSVMPYLRSNGCPSGPELAPIICQFMEPHMGLFKPQLIAPSTFIPPLVVEKCDEPQLEIELPPKKPIVIPGAPILPPITIQKFPVPVIKPFPPMSFVEPCEPGSAVVTSDSADVIVTGLNIPSAPILPPLEMPAFPEMVAVHGAAMSEAVVNDQSLIVPHVPVAPTLIPEFPVVPPVIAPCPEDEPIAVPLPEFIRPLSPLPAAPVLPPARLPEIPVRVEISSKPILPPMIVEHLDEPCITGELVQPKPMIFAQPPRIPELMPVISAHEPSIIADPCEPAIQPVMKTYGHPYFVRTMPSYMPAPGMEPVLYPAHRMLPYMRRI